MLKTGKFLIQRLLLVLVVLCGVLLLWEIPHYKGNILSHKDQVLQLGTKLTPYEIKTFLHHVSTRLPFYQEQFRQAESKTGLSWILLAAVSYQESRWNRHAISPTGVRGLMMLTRSTAADLGIRNRLDPSKSISGGARYLASLHRRISPEIPQADRMYMALAAYNIGMGHIEDARLLAKRSGMDPNKWDDLKEVLPLLAKKQYYKDLPHRYARGWEPVQYVKRIREFKKILLQVDKYQNRKSRVQT